MAWRWLYSTFWAMVVATSVSVAAAAAARWEAVEQPELRDELEKAALLPVESLGVPVRTVQPWSRTLVPNPDGKTWDILQWYFKDYRQNTRVYIADLGTGEVRKQEFPECEGRVCPEACSWVLYWDGKLYGATPDWSKWATGGGMNIYVYDPAQNEIRLLMWIAGLGGERHQLLLGPDKRLYGVGTYLAEGKPDRVGAYCLDPRTGQVRVYGPLGPSHGGHIAFAYWAGVDETHIYIASGKIPWYLLAVEIATGDTKVLMEAPPGDYANRMWVRAQYPGAWVIVQQGDQAPRKEFWLHQGKFVPKTDDKPPWPASESPWDKAPPRPEIYAGQVDPDAEGNAWLWYRLPEDAAKAPKEPPPTAKPEDLGWRPIPLQGVEQHSLAIHRLVLLPDGRLFGTAQGYKGRFIFDPASRTATLLGRGGASPYAFVVHEGKVYWSGYASAPIYVFDPARPWTLEKGGPPGTPLIPQTSPESNPRLVGDVFAETRVKKMFSAVVAADGRIYFGGIGQRDYTGGGLGWYDPRTGDRGGMWRPFSGYRIHWLTTASNGRYVVISTRTAPDELNNDIRPEHAKVFVYDAHMRQIVRDIVPVPQAAKAGPLVEVVPAPDKPSGFLLGTTEDPDTPGGGILYGLDIESGEVFFRKKLPRSLQFAWSQGTTRWDYQRGPDGFVWTTLGEVLVRIDPRDARVHVVGRIVPQGKFVFVGKDLYLAGAEELRHIANIVPGQQR